MTHTKDEIFNKLLAYVCSVPDDGVFAGELYQERYSLIDEAKASLAQPAQEPVAYGMRDTMIGKGDRMMYVRLDKGQDGCTVPLYTTPPQRTWVGLTEEEIQECLKGLPTQTIDVYARRIEAKLKEKNNG